MIERKIRLTDTEEVKDFVRAAGKCDFDIDVCYNRAVTSISKSHFPAALTKSLTSSVSVNLIFLSIIFFALSLIKDYLLFTVMDYAIFYLFCQYVKFRHYPSHFVAFF